MRCTVSARQKREGAHEGAREHVEPMQGCSAVAHCSKDTVTPL